MALASGQWQVRDLVMGPGTVHRIMADSNAFAMTVRDPQTQDRPYAHGSVVGAEWMNERVVPIRVLTDASEQSAGAWLAAYDELAAAFAPVGDSGEMVELRFELGGSEFVLFGRPRMVDPDTDLIEFGRGFTRCAFVAPDPRRYSGALTSVSLSLPVQSGGLTVPVTAPVAVSGQLVGGRVSLTNSGTSAAPLTARIDGPVVEPGIVLQRPDGSVQSVRLDLTLLSGQWLDIDSVNRTAYLNGLVTANQRPSAAWQMDAYPILPGVTRARFTAGEYDAAAGLSLSTRSAWL